MRQAKQCKKAVDLQVAAQRGIHMATRRPPYIFAAIVILLGLGLVIGGAYLISLGGSLYYLLAGAGLLTSGYLLWRGSLWGSRLYGLVLVGTLTWGLMEVGFDLVGTATFARPVLGGLVYTLQKIFLAHDALFNDLI